jgi:hypothetical protein
MGYVRQHGRRKEIASVANTLAAASDFRAARNRVGRQRLHCVHAARMGHWAHRHAFLQPIADLDRLCGLDEAIDEFGVDALVHDEPRRGDADLSGIAELRRRQNFDYAINIGDYTHLR